MKATTIFIFCLVLGGCSRSPELPAKITKEGVDTRKDPLGTMGALSNLGSDMEKIQKELDKLPPTDPVHYSKLVAALPPVPGGWTATEPKGSNNEAGGFKISLASRDYRQKGGGSAKVEISDWAYNRSLYMPFFLQAKFSQESTTGYSKGITFGEDPGREEYNTKSRGGSRQVLVKKRYYVKVSVRRQDVEAIDQWWKSVNVGALP